MMRTLLLALILPVGSIYAQTSANYCGLNAPQPDEVIPSNEVSGNYWTNMLDDDTVMFTADGGVSGTFQAYDLKHKVAYKLTNEIDPFPVPDGRRIYVHPEPLQFFEFDSILKKVNEGGDQAQLTKTDGFSPIEDIESRKSGKAVLNPAEMNDPIAYKNYVSGDKDGRMWGYYESVGVLESSKKAKNNFSKYRVLTGEGEGAFKDYIVRFKPDGGIDKVESSGPAKVMCKNLRSEKKPDLDFDTPILSPKGDEFAVTDRDSQTTKIIKFDPETGDCKVAQDLGFEAGKVHFSPDGSKIAFHTQALQLGSTKVTTQNNRGYLLDRKTNKITSLKVGEEDEKTTEQYPVFLSDGRILYQRVKYDPSTGKQSRAWVKVDPKKLNEAHYSKVTEEDCANDQNLPLKAIGKLYNEVCSTFKQGDELMWTLNLDPNKCKSLVEDKWEVSKKAIKETAGDVPEAYLSKEMLLSACPTKDFGKIKILKDDEGEKMKYPAIIGERCVVCHVQGSPRGYIPFDKPEELRKMKAFGQSAEAGQPFEGKTFLEQMNGILDSNMEGRTPPPGVPRVPADGPRLKNEQIKEIMKWVNEGEEVK